MCISTKWYTENGIRFFFSFHESTTTYSCSLFMQKYAYICMLRMIVYCASWTCKYSNENIMYMFLIYCDVSIKYRAFHVCMYILYLPRRTQVTLDKKEVYHYSGIKTHQNHHSFAICLTFYILHYPVLFFRLIQKSIILDPYS